MSTSKRKKAITRREFIQCSVFAVAGISTFCTLCYGASVEKDKIGNLKVEKDDEHKCEFKPVAYCGVYCGACPTYVNAIEDTKYAECCGCASDDDHRSKETCKVRKCARNKKIETCAFCPEYNTCGTWKESLHYGFFLKVKADKNLDEIRSKGLEKWQREQRAQWTCKYCGSPYSWGDRECRKCHKPVTNWLK